MKTLNDYTDKKFNEVMEKHGAFYAFNMKQYMEGNTTKAECVRLGAGLHCPKDRAERFLADAIEVIDEGIRQDLSENGREGIIIRELNNYESFYTGSIQSVVNALDGYNITRKEIIETYNAELTRLKSEQI